jgi:hypothetical protein
LLFIAYLSTGVLGQKLVMLARTCGTSGACRAAVGAHTCTATAACAHTASGASVDSGTTSGVHRVSAHSRCIILQIFHATRLRMLFWTASHRVFTSHFTLTPEWSHLVPAQGRDSRSHGCARHKHPRRPCPLRASHASPSGHPDHIPAERHSRTNKIQVHAIPPGKSSNLVPPKHTLFFPPTGFARQWS